MGRGLPPYYRDRKSRLASCCAGCAAALNHVPPVRPKAFPSWPAFPAEQHMLCVALECRYRVSACTMSPSAEAQTPTPSNDVPPIDVLRENPQPEVRFVVSRWRQRANLLQLQNRVVTLRTCLRPSFRLRVAVQVRLPWWVSHNAAVSLGKHLRVRTKTANTRIDWICADGRCSFCSSVMARPSYALRC